MRILFFSGMLYLTNGNETYTTENLYLPSIRTEIMTKN